MKYHILKVILLWLIFLFPLLVLVLYSFSGQWAFPSLLPDTMNFRTVLYLKENAGQILIHIGSSFAYSISAVGLSIIYSLLPAEFLSRNEFTGKKLIESLLLAPAVLPVMTFFRGNSSDVHSIGPCRHPLGGGIDPFCLQLSVHAEGFDFRV